MGCVEKNTGDKVSATSPVAITNREFNTNTVETQLSAAEGSSVYASAVALFGTAADSLTFEKLMLLNILKLIATRLWVIKYSGC